MANDPYGSPGLDLTQVKQRAARMRQEPEPQPKPDIEVENPRARKMSDATRESFENLKVALKEETIPVVENSTDSTDSTDSEEGRVDLGELPDDVRDAADNLREPTVFYRNTPMDNEEVREAIEDRCTSLNFSDLILSGRVQQHVSILEGRIEATFQSLKASDNLWIERQASKMQLEDSWVSSAWLGYARLAMCLYAFNGDVLPAHCLPDGSISGDAFKSKMAFVTNLNERVIEVLLINLGWFDDRVNQLFHNDFDSLKNG